MEEGLSSECPSSPLVEVFVCDTKMDLLSLECDDDVTKAHHCIVCHVMSCDELATWLGCQRQLRKTPTKPATLSAGEAVSEDG